MRDLVIVEASQVQDNVTDILSGICQRSTLGMRASFLNFVAADVSPLTMPGRRSEPTHVACCEGKWITTILTGLLALALILPIAVEAAAKDALPEGPWCSVFSVNKKDLSDTGKNWYFFLWPGYRQVLHHGKETLVISVLDETKLVDGVKTRVVEERETNGGKLVEVSRNYFAISRRTGDVYYFGEDVDIYKNGKVVSHKGAWLAGIKGATFGLMMPGRPNVGDRYYQEVAPGMAMDRAEIVSKTEDFTTPQAIYERCVRVRETSGLETGSEDKLYAPDVGLIKDGKLVLTGVDCPLCKGQGDVPTYPAR